MTNTEPNEALSLAKDCDLEDHFERRVNAGRGQMNRAQINHLRRLVAWVRCEIGQSPEELVETVREVAEKWDGPISHEAERRLVEAHDKARSVPQYVRAAVKSLEQFAKPGEVITGESPEALAQLADCRDLTQELKEAQAQRDKLREALKDLITATQHLNPCPGTLEAARAAIANTSNRKGNEA